MKNKTAIWHYLIYADEGLWSGFTFYSHSRILTEDNFHQRIRVGLWSLNEYCVWMRTGGSISIDAQMVIKELHQGGFLLCVKYKWSTRAALNLNPRILCTTGAHKIHWNSTNNIFLIHTSTNQGGEERR